MVVNETREQQLARAKGYPYARPDTSFLFVAGSTFLFDNANWRGLGGLDGIVGRSGSTSQAFAAARGVDLAALSREELFWPVLAIGSNAGPEQLKRKYPPEQFPDAVIPVVQIALDDFDVVYTPYVSSYGSCTATLEYSPGTTACIFITYLTEPLMQRMHATEGGYNLCRLAGLRLQVAPRAAPAASDVKASPNAPAQPADGAMTAEDGPSPADGTSSHPTCYQTRDWVYQYNHKLGCISLPVTRGAATPVAIAEIPARGRRFPAATQVQMLEAIRDATAGPASDGPLAPVALEDLLGRTADSLSDEDPLLDEWILTNISNRAARTALGARLAQHALPFTYPQSQVLEEL